MNSLSVHTSFLCVCGREFRSLHHKATHRYLQCVRIHRVRQSFAAKSTRRTIFSIICIEHHIFRCKIASIRRQQFRKDQVTFVAINILIRIAIDK